MATRFIAIGPAGRLTRYVTVQQLHRQRCRSHPVVGEFVDQRCRKQKAQNGAVIPLGASRATGAGTGVPFQILPQSFTFLCSSRTHSLTPSLPHSRTPVLPRLRAASRALFGAHCSLWSLYHHPAYSLSGSWASLFSSLVFCTIRNALIPFSTSLLTTFHRASITVLRITHKQRDCG